MWPSQLSLWALGLSVFTGSYAAPMNLLGLLGPNGPEIAVNSDFPDPSFIQGDDGMWYAFGTNGRGYRIQVATSKDFKTWDLLDKDALGTGADWETPNDHWAPHVIKRNDGKYVMYYSGEAKKMLRHHCVGTAVSEGTDPSGPYITNPEPLSCRLDNGGSIDPTGFQDTDGTRYVAFKVDGNSVGNGGDCNNSIEPIRNTPIMLQKVEEDGFTPIGEAVDILDRHDSDGPLVEAPNLVEYSGTYFLFYSTHCFDDSRYDVRYATSKSITGPYNREGGKFLKTGDWNLSSPGGGTISQDGNKIIFHGWCQDGKARCAYAADISLFGGNVSML